MYSNHLILVTLLVIKEWLFNIISAVIAPYLLTITAAR